jgi:arylsulfatase A-like enzyme
MAENTSDKSTRKIPVAGWIAGGAVVAALGWFFLKKDPVVAEEASRRPNVIVIYADDLGWTELSSYGNTQVQTPHLDALAATGVRFTQAYSTAPICSPSRAGLITGRYQQRFGFEFLVPLESVPPVYDEALKEKIRQASIERKEVAETGIVDSVYNRIHKGIPLSEITIGQVFKDAGYTTGAVGKWHVGEHEEFQPQNRGFDYYYGVLTWGSIYASVKNPDILTRSYHFHLPQSEATKREGSISIVRNGEVVEETEYITDRFADEAVDFIGKNKEKPFFLYVPFTTPHDPFQAKKSDFDLITTETDTVKRIYLAMIKSLDDAVGRITAKLKAEGLDKNTIILFGSDNGGASYTHQMTNHPLKGGKLSHFEGGIRVPFIANYPGVIPEGVVYNHPVSNLDFFATATAAAGIPLPPDRTYDGVNLIPYVKGENTQRPHEVLYWRNAYSKAIRKSDWKLYINERAGKTLLYDLSKDLSEKNDLAAANPDKVAELKADLQKWEDQLPAPLWPYKRSVPLLELEDASYYFPI